MLSPAPRCLLLAGLCALLACQHAEGPGAGEPSTPGPIEGPFDAASYRRAEAERIEFFEREVERLRADLRQAEESLVAMESGLRGFQSRADAVSALAEASRQLQSGHVGSAVFFASRAQRITQNLQAEVRQVAGWSQRSLVLEDEVELRTAPSGEADVVDRLVADTPVFPERSRNDWTLVRTPSGRIGWVHASRLSTP